MDEIRMGGSWAGVELRQSLASRAVGVQVRRTTMKMSPSYDRVEWAETTAPSDSGELAETVVSSDIIEFPEVSRETITAIRT
jgi:hypothetical protein